MKFKVRKILTERQVRKAKWSMAIACALALFSFGSEFVMSQEKLGLNGETYYENEEEDLAAEKAGKVYAYKPWEMKMEAPVTEEGDNKGKFAYKKVDADGNPTTEYYNRMEIVNYPRGRIVKFSNKAEICTSKFLLPGTDILPTGLLQIAYTLTLCWLFLGISIVADIFMSAIEKITSQTTTFIVKNKDGTETRKTGFIWNPTVANLSLMALGSSAPEILLNCLETLQTMEKCPGELGPSTIVGSAAFNLLVISGLSIYAVSFENDTDPRRDSDCPQGVKKIYDLGVFAITSTVSILAYIWLWIVLMDQNVTLTEAIITFSAFWVLLIICYAADRYKAKQQKKKDEETGKKSNEVELFEYQAVDFYKTLIKDKESEEKQDQQTQAKSQKMKGFLKEQFGHDQIEKVPLDELKKKVEGEGMLAKAKYRRQVQAGFTGKRPAIAKGEIVRQEHEHAEFLDDNVKNQKFGFNCLHYSVSEASQQLRVMVLNKTGESGRVRVVTIDDAAKAGEDYEAVDTILQFARGEKQKFVEVLIKDDEDWEPDEDFFMQLYDAESNDELEGKDTRTRITIIDDDKPGQIYFQETKNVQADANQETVAVVIERRNGSDGIVTVDYKTSDLDESPNTATAGLDYEHVEGTLEFKHGETQKDINIVIKSREDLEVRDESFLVQLSNVTPAGAKLSKKSYMVVNIVTDAKAKKQQEALAQLLKKIEEEEEITWKGQIINACMCHPTKNEDGDIEDVEAMTAFIHFASIFWKLAYFTTCPPPHYWGGWACFVCSLTMIGVATWIVADFASILGCVFGFDPKFTAITFVALGTSLPDTFASMTAATQDKYADPALGNVTGSNAVNVFLGLGLPWMIATIWEQGVYASTEDNNGYFIEAGDLGFSVVVFTVLAITCIITIIIRRNVVLGELGGSKNGRIASCAFLCSLWIIYVVLSTLKMNDAFDPGRMNIDPEKVHRLPKCWSEKQITFMKADPNGLYEKKLAISDCIAQTLKARRSTADAPWGDLCKPSE